MRVTSLIGGTERPTESGGTTSFSRFRNLQPPGASNSLTRRFSPPPRSHSKIVPAAWPRVLEFFGAPLLLKPCQGPGRGVALRGLFLQAFQADRVEVAPDRRARFVN